MRAADAGTLLPARAVPPPPRSQAFPLLRCPHEQKPGPLPPGATRGSHGQHDRAWVQGPKPPANHQFTPPPPAPSWLITANPDSQKKITANPCPPGGLNASSSAASSDCAWGTRRGHHGNCGAVKIKQRSSAPEEKKNPRHASLGFVRALALARFPPFFSPLAFSRA